MITQEFITAFKDYVLGVTLSFFITKYLYFVSNRKMCNFMQFPALHGWFELSLIITALFIFMGSFPGGKAAGA
jgi:hypothetical protein